MFSNRELAGCASLCLSGLLLAACGGGGGSEPTPVAASPNGEIRITVDSGPNGTDVNRLYTSVTICKPGSATLCQTIDHVLVDTGSVGLRLLSSVVSPALQLSPVPGPGGFALLNCAQFFDNTFAWGPVASADVLLGGQTAANVPIQVISDPAFNTLAPACSTGIPINASTDLGANGILGLGLFTEDCGTSCVTFAANGFYYTCTSASCTAITGTTVSANAQVKNVVPLFASNHNGFVIDLPGVSPAGTTTLSGALIFGIGTSARNQPGAVATLMTDSYGNFTTQFAGRNLINSFIDSGSNGLYFPSATIPTCSAPGITDFYCPISITTLSATLFGVNLVGALVSFSIDNAATLLADPSKAVLPTLSGPSGDPSVFDWGLPFFYGRRVFFGIDGQTSALGTGPLIAF